MRFDRFTERAQDAAMRAYELMQRFGHSQVDVEHLFLALLTQPQGEVPNLLKRLNAPLEAFEVRLRENLERTPRSPAPSTEASQANQVFITPRFKRVVDQAVAEARQLQDELHSTEHLLLGIVSDSKGFSGALLSGAGITRQQILNAIRQARGASDLLDGGTATPVEPLLQRQRRLLATFRLSTEQRLKVEAQVDSRLQGESQSAQSGLQHMLDETKARAATASRSQQRGPELLASVALHGLWTNSRATAATKLGADKPIEAFEQAVKSSEHSLESLGNLVEALTVACRSRRNRREVLAIIALLAVIAAGLIGYQIMRAESLYRTAVTALEAGNGEEAQTPLAELKVVNPGYKDSEILLEDARALIALGVLYESRDWVKAKAATGLDSDQAEVVLRRLVASEVKEEAEAKGWATYEIKPGDMIDPAAQKLGVPTERLKQYNSKFYPDISKGVFRPGWIILVPPRML